MALPSNVNFGTVTGVITRAADDGADTDRHPDGIPVRGLQFVFTADLAPSIVRNATATPPTIIQIMPITAITDDDGVLCAKGDGLPGVELVASVDPDLDPNGWSWTATVDSTSFPMEPFSFTVSPGQVIDLTTVIRVPANPGAEVIQWQAAVADTLANKVAAQAAATNAAASAASVPTPAAITAEIGAAVAPKLNTAALDSTFTTIDANAASAYRVQADARQNATMDGKVTAAKGLLPVNVKDAPYNAVGDGIANDTAAIQAALNASTIVYMPPGSYLASGLILTTGQTLYGAGVGATTILHNVGNDCLAATGTSPAPLKGINVRDLTISANGLNANQRGIYFQYVDDSTIERVKISGAGNNGINWYTSKRSKVLNSEITAVLNFGILVYRCADLLVQGCDIHHISTAAANLGIQFKSSQQCQALDNRVNNITGYGIYTWDDALDVVNYPDRDHIISGNQVHDCTTGGTLVGTGIFVNVTSGARVVNNTVVQCAAGSISSTASVGVVIEGNRCHGTNDGYGIGLSGGAKFGHIAGNSVSGYGQGITLDAAHHNRVIGNNVYNLMASASSLAAGLRIRNTSNNNAFLFNRIIDDQTVPTMRRGIYLELGSYNLLAFNAIAGATVNLYGIIGTTSTEIGNTTTLVDNPMPVGGASGKLGFFGKAPIVQPTGTAAVATDAATTQALVNDLRAKLIALGVVV